jgi:hypothetical protein
MATEMTMATAGDSVRRAAAAAALLLLNVSVTFENVWPTPAVTWRGGVSAELALVTIVLAPLLGRFGPLTRRAAAALAAGWMLLVCGRYLEVTAPALYGRDINLYWDLRFIPDVAAMIVRVMPPWLVLGLAVAAAAAGWVLHRILRWAFQRVADAIGRRCGRRTIMTGAGAALVLFTLQRLGVPIPLSFPAPVTHVYAHQLWLIARASRGAAALPPTPSMDSSFGLLDATDVFLVFIESYGAVSYRPDIAAGLAPARAAFGREIAATGRGVVSALVESPTFGGSSWLAHISLVSGVEVRDADTNALLMAQRRDTLVKSFARHRFRTIALMPGLRQQWPEGGFYGFDEIYGADRLAYAGPEFGWFAIPDQFSLARFDALEPSHGAGRRFVFFPTISTHFPFSPTPPYQPNWDRLFTTRPYDGPDIVRAYAHPPDWTNFTPGYIEALAYDFAVLGGYLGRWPDRRLVMVLIGDHQPPAAVSGRGASWNVPVHVIANESAILDRLRARGFVEGLVPAGQAISRMHLLLPMLLEAFGDHD